MKISTLLQKERQRTPELTTMSIPTSIIYLAWPVVLRMSLQMIVGIVDLAMVGSLGAAAIASVGIGNNLLWFIISATTAFSVGTTALVARNIGAKDYQEAAETARQSIAVAFIIATFIGILSLIFSEDIIRLMIITMKNPDPAVIKYGTQYFAITALSFPFFFTLMVLNGIQQGAGDMKTPLKVMIIANIINILLDWVLIYGVGPFPRWEVAGASVASAISRIYAFGASLYVLLTGKAGFKVTWPKKFRFNPRIIGQVTKVGIPAAVEQLVNNLGTTLLTVVIAGLGTPALAANQIVLRGISIANMPAFGFNMAATTLVGQNLGARKIQRAEETGYTAVKMAMWFMLILGSVIFIFAKPITLIFTREAEVITLAVLALRIVSLSLPFMGIFLTFAGALRGAGDTMWVMLITIIGVMGSRVGLAVLLVYLGFGFTSIWLAFGIDFAVRALMFYFRYRNGHWKNIKLRKEEFNTTVEITE